MWEKSARFLHLQRRGRLPRRGRTHPDAGPMSQRSGHTHHTRHRHPPQLQKPSQQLTAGWTKNNNGACFAAVGGIEGELLDGLAARTAEEEEIRAFLDSALAECGSGGGACPHRGPGV